MRDQTDYRMNMKMVTAKAAQFKCLTAPKQMAAYFELLFFLSSRHYKLCERFYFLRILTSFVLLQFQMSVPGYYD